MLQDRFVWVKFKIIKGLNYTNLTTSSTATSGNNPIPTGSTIGTPTSAIDGGLLPDLNYSTVTSIEDCPYSRNESITTPLKAIFVPQDYNALNLKSVK